MRSIRRLLVAGAMTIALAVFVPSALAASPMNFHLDKTCAADASEPLGYVCTVQHSDFKWIPPGTKVHYTSQTGNVVQASITIKNGSTNGVCVWSDAANAICTFRPGTGRFTQFHLQVVVSVVGDPNDWASVWHWDGTYWFGGGD